MNIYNDYLELTEKKKLIDAQILELQKEIYIKHQKELDNMSTGTFNASSDGFKIKIIKKETVNVDQELASTMNYGFDVKFALNKKEYNKLTDEQKARVDECLSSKPAKPSFIIERE